MWGMWLQEASLLIAVPPAVSRVRPLPDGRGTTGPGRHDCMITK